VSGAAGRALAGTDAAGRYDLLTVLSHELGHVLGLEDQFTSGQLMSVMLPEGLRRSISTTDVAQANLGNDAAEEAHALHGNINVGSLTQGIANGNFGAGGSNPTTGWETLGSATVVGGALVLSENGTSMTRASQAFLLPN